MKKKIIYTDPDEPLMFGKQVFDLDIPSPAEIAEYLKSKGQKVTITLDPTSVAFFKKQAQKHGSKYQAMIREVVTRYAKRHRR